MSENGIQQAHPSLEVSFDPEQQVVGIHLHGIQNWQMARMLLEEAKRLADGVIQQDAMKQAMAAQQAAQQGQVLRSRLKI